MAKPSSVSEPQLQRIGAIVLAAGGSVRMGRPKQLLPVAGMPLIVRAVEAVAATTLSPLIVVLGREAESVRLLLANTSHQLVDNPDWERGIGTSIRAGMRRLSVESNALDGVLLTPIDQPKLSAHALQRLIAAFRGPDTIVASQYDGICGAPALFGRVYFGMLQALDDGEGARRVLQAHAASVVPVPLPELALDLDTPEDFQRYTASENRSG